ncbi:MAG: redoxin family protein [Chloroherpetonaceae bacterium]|nr:redoxin family protein [Chloroherpetonaceae bacterium]
MIQRLLLTFIFLSAILFAGRSSAQGLKRGDRLPDAGFTVLNGASFNTQSLKGKSGVLVIFVSTQCPVSNAYNARYNGLYQLTRDANIGFFVIYPNVTESATEIDLHAKEKGFRFSVVRDNNAGIAKQFGATVTPEAFLFDASLKLIYRGRIDDNQREDRVTQKNLEEAIAALLSGSAPLIPVTPARGCVIKTTPDDF